MKKVLLSEITSFLARGAAPKYTEKDDFYVLNQKCIRDWRVSLKDARFTDTEAKKVHDDRILRDNDILVNSTGQGTLGRVAQFLKLDRPATVDSHITIVRPTPDLVFPEYLGYVLKGRQNEIELLAEGSTGQTELSKLKLANISIDLPPLDQQKKIANILGSLDEKIEFNRRMNETLEQLGQALFRHYFVDNPEAKSWDDVKVGELVDIKGGGTPSTKNSSFWGGDIVWSSPRDLANQRCHFLMRTDKTITKQGLSKISSGMLPAGTLLLSSRAPIGYIAFAGVDMAINQGYIAFLPKAKLSNYFMYFWLKNNIQKIKDSANGSTFLEISKTAFRNIYIKQPNQLLHNKFQYEAMIILDKIRDNEAEIYNLTSLRDSLLPKLISGEIEV